MKYLKLFENIVESDFDWDDFDEEEFEDDFISLRDKTKGDKSITFKINDYNDWKKFIDYNNSEGLEIFWAGGFDKPTLLQYSDRIRFIQISNRNLVFIDDKGFLPSMQDKIKIHSIDDLISDVRKKPSRFSKFKKWLKNESKDIEPFDEDDWDYEEEDTEYYMGKISFDHIEIFRVLLEDGEVLRYADNFKIRNYNNEFSPIKKRVDQGAIFIDRPHFFRHGELIYFYSNSNKLKKEKMISILEANIYLATGADIDLRNKFLNIINNHEIFYYGDSGSTTNLI